MVAEVQIRHDAVYAKGLTREMEKGGQIWKNF